MRKIGPHRCGGNLIIFIPRFIIAGTLFKVPSMVDWLLIIIDPSVAVKLLICVTFVGDLTNIQTLSILC